MMIDSGAVAFSDLYGAVRRTRIDDNDLIDIFADAFQTAPQTGLLILHNHAERDGLVPTINNIIFWGFLHYDLNNQTTTG